MSDPVFRWTQSRKPETEAATPTTSNEATGLMADMDPAPVQRHGPVSMIAPIHHQPGYQYPLLVWLHNGGNNEHQFRQVIPHISVRNYVGLGVRGVRAVDVSGRQFDWPSTRSGVHGACAATSDAIDAACDEFSIHPDRIILAGYQTGGTMALRVAMAQPDRFAGVICVGGAFPRGHQAFGDFPVLRRRRLPILWQRTLEQTDENPDQFREDLSMAQLICAKLEVRHYVGGDVMNTVAMKDIDRWCFDAIIQPKPDVAPPATSMAPSDWGIDEAKPVRFSEN